MPRKHCSTLRFYVFPMGKVPSSWSLCPHGQPPAAATGRWRSWVACSCACLSLCPRGTFGHVINWLHSRAVPKGPAWALPPFRNFWNMTQNHLDQELSRRRRVYLIPAPRVACCCLSTIYPWVSDYPRLNCYNERLIIFFRTLKFGQGSEWRTCPCSLM